MSLDECAIQHYDSAFPKITEINICDASGLCKSILWVCIFCSINFPFSVLTKHSSVKSSFHHESFVTGLYSGTAARNFVPL